MHACRTRECVAYIAADIMAGAARFGHCTAAPLHVRSGRIRLTLRPVLTSALASALLLALVLAPLSTLTAQDSSQDSSQTSSQDSTASVSISGFVFSTLFWQNRAFAPADGSSALYVADSTPRAAYGGDVRDTRVALDFNFAQLPHDWHATGVLSMDFFGGFKGDGTFAFVQPRPRIRNAIVTLSHAGTSISAGQINPPIFGFTPVSTSHPLTFPLGYGTAGLIGVYSPGIEVKQTFAHHGPDMWKISGAMLENQWKGIGGFDNVLTPAALSPRFQARLDYQHQPDSGARLQVFVAGEVDHKNLTNLEPLPNDGSFTGWAALGGLRLRDNALTLQGSGYYGHAIGQEISQIFQFGNFSGWGAWGQVGWDFTDHLGVWGFAGMSRQDENSPEVKRPENITLVPMLRFQWKPVEIGLEWMHVRTDWFESPNRSRASLIGNQIAFSTLLHY